MNNIIYQHYCTITGLLSDSLMKSEHLYRELAAAVNDTFESGRLFTEKVRQAESRFCQHASSLISDIELLAPGTIPLLPPPAKEENNCFKLCFYRCLLDDLTAAVKVLVSRCQAVDEESKPQAEKSRCRRKKSADDVIRIAEKKAERVCRISVCGGHGSGKTSLIKAVTPEGTVPESAINCRSEGNYPSAVYRNGALQFKEQVDGNFCRGRKLSAEKNQADCIWYCIDGSNGTVSSEDMEKIREYGGKALVIVTKSELMRKESILPLMSELLQLVDRDRIVIVSAESSTGLCRLWEKSWQNIRNIPDILRKNWEKNCRVMKQQWQEIADCEAEKYISWTAGADRLPERAVEAEVHMICKLAGIYGVAVNMAEVEMLRQCGGGMTAKSGKAAKLYFESDMSISADELRRKSCRFRC